MIRSKLASLAFAALMSVGGQAFAITGDWIPDNDHPFVGLIAFYGSDGEFIWRCSGALISPTVFLTAGHCADTVGGATTARIWFQQNAGANYNPATQHDPVTGYPDDCAAGTLGVLCAEVSAGHIYNFGFTGELTLPNTHDVGIVVLDQTPSAVTEYGQLPQAGQLDALATARGRQSVLFTESGYGLTYKPKDKSGKPATSYRVRLMAESLLVNLRSGLNDGFNLQTQGNGTGLGGTCNGDSGGPMFLGPFSSNLVVGVTSFGLDSLCRGTDYAYRVDTAAVQNWIQATVGRKRWAAIAP